MFQNEIVQNEKKKKTTRHLLQMISILQVRKHG